MRFKYGDIVKFKENLTENDLEEVGIGDEFIYVQLYLMGKKLIISDADRYDNTVAIYRSVVEPMNNKIINLLNYIYLEKHFQFYPVFGDGEEEEI